MAMRAAAAALLVLSLVLMEARALGWAEAPPPAEVPSVAVPAPHVGDRGVYRTASSDGESWLTRFQVLPPATMNDTWGSERAVFVVRTERTDDESPSSDERAANAALELRYYDAATLALLATEQRRALATESPATGHHDATDAVVRFVDPTDADLAAPSSVGPAPCGFFHALQGSTVRLGARTSWSDACLMGDSGRPLLGATELETEAYGLFEKQEALRLRPFRPAPGDAVAPAWNFSVWFTGRAPYPALVALDHGGAVVRSFQMQLLGFVPGVRPLIAVPTNASVRPAPLSLPREPWGPSDAGVAHPFPLSRAWTEAWGDPLQPGLRDFIAAHPDATVVSASHDGRSWHIVVSDGRAVFETCRAPSVMTPCLGQTVASEGSCAPRDLPSIAALEEQWHRVTRPDESDLGLQGWSYGLQCEGTTPRILLRILHYERKNAEAAGLADGDGPASSSVRWAYLSVDGSGAIRSIERGEERGDTLLSMTAVRSSRQVVVTRPHAGSIPPPQILPAAFVVAPASQVLTAAAWTALALAVAVAVASYVKSGVGFGFSRLDRRSLLDQATRAHVASVVAADPGVHLREIARRVGRPRGTVAHHLQVLVGHRVLVEHEGDGFRCYFPAGGVDRRLHAAAPVLKAPGARLVLELAASRPGVSISEAARAAGMSRQGASNHARRLQVAGLLDIAIEGRHRRIRATAGGQEAIQRLLRIMPP